MTKHQVKTAEALALEKLRKKALLFELHPDDCVDLTSSVERAEGVKLDPPVCATDVEVLHELAHQLVDDEHSIDWLKCYLELVKRWCDMETESLMRQEFLRQGIRFSRPMAAAA